MTEEIRHFQVDVPQEELDDLRRRVAAIRWPDRELVDDRSQGMQLATIQALADQWVTHDWRRVRETDLALRVPEMGLRRRDVRARAVIDVDHF